MIPLFIAVYPPAIFPPFPALPAELSAPLAAQLAPRGARFQVSRHG